jgi:hypothetical protein
VGELESLEAVTGLSLFTHNIQNRVNKLSTFSVVALGPVVSGSALPEDDVIGPEDLSVGSGADGVHGAGLKIEKDRSGDILATTGLVVVDLNALKLEF